MSRVELQKKWWTANRPKGVKGVELEKALGLVEQAGDDRRAAALATLSPAIAKACAELDKKAHKDLLKDLATLEDLADAEAKKLVAAAAKAAKAATKVEAQAAPEDEPTEDKLFDPELHRNTLKRALRQELVFAFAVGSKPENRVLALAARGNPTAFGRLAKARGGGARVCFGRAQAAEGESNKLVLTLESAPIPGTVKALRAYLKENKITLFRKIAVSVNGEEDEAEGWDEEPPEVAAEPDRPAPTAPEVAAAGQAPPSAGAAAAPVSPPSAAAAAEAQVPEIPPTPQQIEVLDDRRREFKKARAAWVGVKARAEEDLEKVKDGAQKRYLADGAQFPKIVAGCKAIDTILDNLDDALRDTLDQYASTPLRNQKKLRALAATAVEVLERYQSYVAGNAVLRAIDQKEFANVTVYAPVMKALGDLRKALA